MMAQLLAHLWGDYILQSDWMAKRKRFSTWACLCHVFLYTACFVPLVWGRTLTEWPAVLGTIFWTHFWMDRYGMARYLCWAKNFMAPVGYVAPRWNGQQQRSVPRRWWNWSAASETGCAPNAPAFLSVWLLIIADNTLHLTINYLALRFL